MKVQVTDYSPTWHEMFEREKQLLASVIKESGSIEHIGSTAVVGLVAKPVIDILIGLDDFSTAGEIVPRIKALGYKYVPEYEDVMPERRYFKRVSTGISTHHIHMVEIGGEFWERHLLFRDFLRANPDAAEEYAVLKKNLAAVEWKDKNDYTEAKTAFIKNIEIKAKQLKNKSGAA